MNASLKFFGGIAAGYLALSQSAYACIVGVDPNCNAVPEPSSWALVALGLVGAIAVSKFLKK